MITGSINKNPFMKAAINSDEYNKDQIGILNTKSRKKNVTDAKITHKLSFLRFLNHPYMLLKIKSPKKEPNTIGNLDNTSNAIPPAVVGKKSNVTNNPCNKNRHLLPSYVNKARLTIIL